jgi:hypothetical protein
VVKQDIAALRQSHNLTVYPCAVHTITKYRARMTPFPSPVSIPTVPLRCRNKRCGHGSTSENKPSLCCTTRLEGPRVPRRGPMISYRRSAVPKGPAGEVPSSRNYCAATRGKANTKPLYLCIRLISQLLHPQHEAFSAAPYSESEAFKMPQ